jgi:hypothetical protein
MSSGTGSPAGDTTGGGGNAGFQGTYVEQGFSVDKLLKTVNDLTVSAKSKIDLMRARRSSISIPDMLDMQMLMNRLSQLTEMTTSVISSANSSIMSIARSIK